MELKDFIKITLTSISGAISESQTELQNKGIIINPEKVGIGKNGEKLLQNNGSRYIQNLEFDILVTVQDQKTDNGKAELKVASIINIGGGLTQGKSSQNQSRIKFNIPVAFSTTPTPKEYRTNALPKNLL